MRIAYIDYCECTNAIGWGISLYTQGCVRKCKGCFSPQTWDIKGGREYTFIDENTICGTFKTTPYFNHLVVEGGEPLLTKNLKTILTLIEKVKATRPDIKIWIYTGYTYEQLKERIKKNKNDYYLEPILRLADVLVDGPFIQEKKDLTLAFKGSSNQRVIDLQKTYAANDIVLLDI